MKLLSHSLVGLVVVSSLCLMLNLVGMVGIRYPQIVENEPLKSPVRVIRIEGNNLELEDGRTLFLDDPYRDSWNDILRQSENMVDVEENGSGFVMVYARQDGWVCGTPWAQPIRIPIIRDIVYKNHREPVGIGKVSKESSQQDTATDTDKSGR